MKKQNSVVILIGGVHGTSARPCVREFTVRIYNTVDLLPGAKPGEGLADSIPNYRGNDELEEYLENLRNNICICYHGFGVDAILKEEDSK